MGFFDDIQNSIPPFKEYYKHMYEKKTLKLLLPDESKVIPPRILNQELVCTTSELNQQIVEITASLGKISASALLAEIRNPKKIIYRELLENLVGETQHWMRTHIV